MKRLVSVLKPGLQTCIQELPGRIGFLSQGFPLSGPFDAWSFRQANLLVGNHRDTAALECQFIGPKLRLDCDCRLAVTGGDMSPMLDGDALPQWQTVHAAAGQVLTLGGARTGARAYIALSGGIDSEPVLGSRAVFHQAGVGGQALVAEQQLPLGEASSDDAIWQIDEARRPRLANDKHWGVEAIAGPNDDWLSADTVDMFFSTDWAIQAQSSRTGIRLTGPEFRFSDKAMNKKPDHGQDASNIVDHGYPMGAVNLAGQTPIILVNDAPSTGGFINPFTVARGAFWKLAQAKPGDHLRFRQIDLGEAAELRAELNRATRPEAPTRV